MRIAATGGPAQETGVVMDGSMRYPRYPDSQRIGHRGPAAKSGYGELPRGRAAAGPDKPR
jgi:hypothetical protein